MAQKMEKRIAAEAAEKERRQKQRVEALKQKEEEKLPALAGL